MCASRPARNKIWWGKINRPIEPAKFEALKHRLCAYLQGKDVFVDSCYAGADERYRVPMRVISERAWHALFARNMFIRELDPEKLAHAPAGVHRHSRAEFPCRSRRSTARIPTAFVVLHFGKKLILIGGTSLRGRNQEIHFHGDELPAAATPGDGDALLGQLSARTDDVAIFFGLSGTGKTTLSADPKRTLIGDDEHGWSDQGVFNFEGGCYAKVIRLSSEGEPEIYETTRRVRDHPGKRGVDTTTRRLESRRRLVDRKYARGLSHHAHPER